MKSGSKKAMSKNIETEMHAGKPQKQAVAIAYSVKRKMDHKAHGGEMDGCPMCSGGYMSEGGRTMGQSENEKLHPHANYAMGGMVHPEELAARIRAKRADVQTDEALPQDEDDRFLTNEHHDLSRSQIDMPGDGGIDKSEPSADQSFEEEHADDEDGGMSGRKRRLERILQGVRMRHMGK